MRPNSTPSVPGWTIASSFALSLAAFGIASYLTVAHYADPAALACPDNSVVNCGLVTTSSWSVIMGVPVALIGLIWGAAMTVLTSPWLWHRSSTVIDGVRLAAAGMGVATVLYLVYVELFRIGAICLWCSAIHVVAVSLLGVLLAGRALVTRARPAHP
jgi:uncharacterized membrane protein